MFVKHFELFEALGVKSVLTLNFVFEDRRSWDGIKSSYGTVVKNIAPELNCLGPCPGSVLLVILGQFLDLSVLGP